MKLSYQSLFNNKSDLSLSHYSLIEKVLVKNRKNTRRIQSGIVSILESILCNNVQAHVFRHVNQVINRNFFDKTQ